MTEILLVCSANICRSPMAAALLARELTRRGVPAVVSSAGTLGADTPLGTGAPPPEVASVMAGRGLDVTGHRSRPVTAADLARADLILALAREHLRHVAVTAPDAWPRAFTLRELVRRGELAGARRPDETLAGWLARAHDGRSRLQLLGDSADDDVADPIGGALGNYERTAADLARLTGRLADLGWSSHDQWPS